jgi:hypothetical protein
MDIADALGGEFEELETRFARGDWGPAELNGGRFAEAVFRYLEWRQSGTFTPIGQQIRDRDKTLNRVRDDSALPEGLRFHVRRCTDLLLDVRNKRDVAHLGSVVDVKEMDAKLVIRLASWALAEIIREESGLPADEVQAIVDRLSATHLPLVEEVDGELVVVATHLSATDRALVALYHAYPDPLPIQDLRRAAKYGHATRFRALMDAQAREAYVHVKNDQARLLRKGVAWVEANIDLELSIG